MPESSWPSHVVFPPYPTLFSFFSLVLLLILLLFPQLSRAWEPVLGVLSAPLSAPYRARVLSVHLLFDLLCHAPRISVASTAAASPDDDAQRLLTSARLLCRQLAEPPVFTGPGAGPLGLMHLRQERIQERLLADLARALKASAGGCACRCGCGDAACGQPTCQLGCREAHVHRGHARHECSGEGSVGEVAPEVRRQAESAVRGAIRAALSHVHEPEPSAREADALADGWARAAAALGLLLLPPRRGENRWWRRKWKLNREDNNYTNHTKPEPSQVAPSPLPA